MRDLVDGIARSIRVLTSLSRGMLLMRLLLAAGVAACLLLELPFGPFFLLLMLCLAAAAVLMPDSHAVSGFVLFALLFWFTGHRPWWMTGLFTAALMLVHWAAIVCAAGPPQARLGRSVLGGRRWAAWAVGSLALAGLVGGTGWLVSGAGGGLALVTAAALVLLVALGALLTLVRPH